MLRYFFLAVVFLMASCNVRERPISYGNDECDYCRMTIMDHRYGAELVTTKGKIFAFDAAECLIDFLSNNEDIAGDARYLLVTPYTTPDHFFDARSATYLVSKKMPSPMGAYLTAFSDPDSAKVYQQKNGGSIYDWQTLKHDFRDIKSGVVEGND